MDISIYKNKSANETEKITTIGARLKENCTRENPILLLDGVVDIGDTADWNYLYIPEWDRYYYVTGFIITDNLLELYCHVDVLLWND